MSYINKNFKRENDSMLKVTQETPLNKLEIEDYMIIPYEEYEDETLNNLKEIEFEMITPVDFSDKRQLKIYNGIKEAANSLNISVSNLSKKLVGINNNKTPMKYV